MDGTTITRASTAPNINPQGLELKTLWRRKHLLVAPVAITLALGAAYLLQTEPVYEAEARILIDPGGIAGAGDRRTRDDRFFMTTQAEILRSPALIERALAAAPPPEGIPAERARALALAGLDVAALDDTHVLRLRFRGPDAAWTNRFLLGVIESYAADLQEAQRRHHAETARLLASREAMLRAELASAREEYADSRRESPLVGYGTDAARLELEALRGIEQQLAETRHRLLDAESRLQAAAQRNGGAEVAGNSPARVLAVSAEMPIEPALVADASDRPSSGAAPRSVTAFKPAADPSTPSDVSVRFDEDLAMSDPARIQHELSQAKARLEQLARHYGPKHPEHQAAQAAAVFWESRLNRALAEATAMSREQVEALKLAERQLQARYDEAVTGVRTLNDHLLADQQQLERLRQLEELHLATRASLVEADAAARSLDADHDLAVLRVLESPRETVTAVWPKPVHLLAACGAISLVGGLVLIGLTEQRRLGRVQPAPLPGAASDGGRPAR